MIDPYIETLCDLVAIPSCSYADGGDEAAVQAYVAQHFCDAGARVRTFDATDIDGFFDHPLCHGPNRNYKNRPTVLGEIGPADGPTLLVMAHSDVVSINNDPALWKITQPFEPLVRDGYIYGRGCSDDKWGVASLIHILRQLRDDATAINKRIIFASTMDEENGVGNGLLLLHLANLGAEAALYLDGTNHQLTVGNLGGSNLYLHLPNRLSRKELEAYESRLIAACEVLSAKRRPMFTGPFADNPVADRSIDARLQEDNTLMIYFYTALGEDGPALGRQLEAMATQTICEHADDMTFSYCTPWFEPTLIEVDHPFVKQLAGSYHKAFGHDALITTISKQDSFVTRKFGLPTVGFGPGKSRGPGGHHLPDERLNIADAQASLGFAHRAVVDWLKA